MNRDAAAHRVDVLRDSLAAANIDPIVVADPSVRSDGTVFLIGRERSDRFTGQQVFDALIPLLDVFELVEPIEGVSKGSLWGPSLIRPSDYTYISPNVVAGEPCIVNSRVPTGTIHALHAERGLSVDGIGEFYPQLEERGIKDAIALEGRLRGVHLEAA